MKIFKIPVVWQSYGMMSIEAETLEEAEEKALGNEPLPTNGEYVTDSCELDKENPSYGENYHI